MVEFSLNPIRYISRVWAMGKLGQTLVIACLVVTVIAIYVGFSMRLNGFGLTAVWIVSIWSLDMVRRSIGISTYENNMALF